MIEDMTPIPNRELELLRASTEGIKMPPAAVAAIQNLISRAPSPPLDTALNTLRERLEEIPQRPPEKHLATILSRIALVHSCDPKAPNLADIALYATQWAYLCGIDGSPYAQVAEEARRSYVLKSPTVFDLAIRAGEAAKSTKLDWNPYFNLVELAGQALAWSAREAEETK